jgi:lysozyme family protein
VDPSNSACDAYSPEFLAAVERVLADEGGYSSSPADPGGATKFGISARAHPGVDIATLTRDAAVNIYWREWWLPFGFAQLPAAIAAKTFDLSVNIGAAHAIQCLQRALRACGSPVTEDGVLGEATALASRRADPAALMAAMRSEAAGYYRILAASRDGAQAFIKGWLNRAYA